MKSTWPPETYLSPHADPRQLELPLPHRPGIKTRRFADQCSRCHGVHLSAEDGERCRQANMQREQF